MHIKYTKRLRMVLMSYHSGKKDLCISMGDYHNKKKQYMFINISTVIDNNENIFKYNELIEIKKHVKAILKTYKKHIIVIVTSKQELFNFLCLTPKQLSCFIPCYKLWKETKNKKLFDEDIVDKIDMHREYLLLNYGKVVTLYGSYDDLRNLIILKFNLLRNI
jgi:hypothetical protein